MTFSRRKLLAGFARNATGATAVEYGLLAMLIALAIVTGAGAIGANLIGYYKTLAAALP